MRIVITGSAGFIAGHLSRELQDAGHIVSGIDIVSGATEDVRKRDNITSAIEQCRADTLIHLAAPSSAESDIMKTLRDHAGMTAVAAQVCGELGVRFIYASSSAIYGDNGSKICDEEDGPFTLPNTIYGLSKGFGEEIGKFYAPDGFTALRFSTPYGPGLPVGRGRAALVNLLWQARCGKPMPVYIGAERSWCWIGDTVRAARLAIERGEGPYNICRDDDPTSMETVAELACGFAAAPESLIEALPLPPQQTLIKRLSTKRLSRFGWEPKVSLYEGMALTYEWVCRLDETGKYVDPAEVASL